MPDLLRLLDQITINTHSSIRIETEGKVLYTDPFGLSCELHDADVIFVTHEHFDHFSPDDIQKVSKDDTVFVVPAQMREAAMKIAGSRNVITVRAGECGEACGVRFEAVAAYNPAKPFHPRANGWVGYVLTVNGLRVYIAGDTDATEEAAAVRCSVAMLPIGGKYTMDPEQAAALANRIKPDVAIPTHYGSVAGTQACYDEFVSCVDPKIHVVRKVPV